MHPTAKRCVQWAVGLVFIGTAAMVFGTELLIRAEAYLGLNGAVALWLIDYVVGGIRVFAVPIAAALVAAAVVVQTLAPARGMADAEATQPDAGEAHAP
ncbi:hypothetical protein QQX09_02725 [Demequina sp. SYSU T00192]|uniref:Uncharacterized protein n=1 Tax=Demequina litoralis TaxID=3051660 RepID=A0ABT8G6K0_9MICO|nr:hypothetical protein [Demequina sp. SYSU T00192]MDN4474765.1 hypothetical protein [Demequina sp. SYSU T00192]